jgi:hypothetical protein
MACCLCIQAQVSNSCRFSNLVLQAQTQTNKYQHRPSQNQAPPNTETNVKENAKQAQAQLTRPKFQTKFKHHHATMCSTSSDHKSVIQPQPRPNPHQHFVQMRQLLPKFAMQSLCVSFYNMCVSCSCNNGNVLHAGCTLSRCFCCQWI